MKKDRIHIYEMESYKHASEEQRNSMRICKIRYFDLEGLPSKEVKEILEAFIWERGKTLALSSLATELTTYNNIRKFLIEKNITVLQNAGPEKTVRILKGWMLEKGLALSSMKYRAAYDITARETPALERKLRQILKFAEVKDEREEQEKDIWELEKFEFPIRRNPIKNVKTLNFTDILQPDIREEVKRTIFLHLKYSALGTIHSEMTAVKRFSRFLNVRKPELESLQELSREDIEDYLIYLQTETTERKNYRSDLYGLKRVIEDVGNIYERTVKNLYSQYSSLNENKSAGEYDDSKIDSALKALKDNAAHEGGGKSIARSSPPRAYSAPSSVSKAKQTSESKEESTEGGNAIENPLVKVQKVKASGILSQVVDDSTVSGNSIDTSARVSGRSLHKGTGGWSESSDDWYAKVLMQQYILTYMSCYTDTNPNHALNYEVEYIIGGRASDKDNLKIVIAEILALRAAANMAYLAGSASKQAQAMALAAIIGGITLTPEVIEGVEKGILAAWAFCESVLDLRALLDGDKIPLIKSDTSWTSSLYGMTSMLTGQVKAKSSNEGIGYKSYLGMLLFTKSMKNIAYRSMDVQEATVRMTGAHESFRMDNAICELSTDVSYKYHGIFLCFVNLLDGADNEYTIKNKAKYSYYGR